MANERRDPGVRIRIVDDDSGYIGADVDSSPIHPYNGIEYIIQHSSPERVYKLEYPEKPNSKGLSEDECRRVFREYLEKVNARGHEVSKDLAEEVIKNYHDFLKNFIFYSD